MPHRMDIYRLSSARLKMPDGAQHFTVQMLPTTLHIGKSEDPQDSTHLITTRLGNSGYANSLGGKCTNCTKMNQECIFQPVSSSAPTAFVLVSALQNGIPPVLSSSERTVNH
ncbi:hypothetical protein PG995_004508 [Apiospora arundinis]